MHSLFQKMGADIRVVPVPPLRARSRFDIRTGRDILIPAPRDPLAGLRVNVAKGTFEVHHPTQAHLQVVSCDLKGGHLLLMARAGRVNQKFLCGHDERDWFVASVPSTVTSVSEAKDSLCPQAVREAVRQAGVRHSKRHTRRNAAFTRQGEWFFVSVPQLVVDPKLILRNEPLIRPGGGKPHCVQELYRTGGESVHVHAVHAPGGLSADAHAKLGAEARLGPGWRVMRSNPEGYARGTVRHPDHATILLNGWHRIHINQEVRRSSLGFLD